MRNFGIRVIGLNKRRASNKFAPKGTEYVLVEYSEEAKAYRLRKKCTRSIVKKRDVRFLEGDDVLIRKGMETDYIEDAYNAPLLKDVIANPQINHQTRILTVNLQTNRRMRILVTARTHKRRSSMSPHHHAVEADQLL